MTCPIVPSVMNMTTPLDCHLYFQNKVTELCGVVAINNPSFVLITESWLDSSIPDSGVTIGDSYNIYRKDRPTTGGGILA